MVNRISNFLHDWKCRWNSGVPICCIIWYSTIWPMMHYMTNNRCLWMRHIVQWYGKSLGHYLYFKGRIENAGYILCPVCLVLKRAKEIKFCEYGQYACQDYKCHERIQLREAQEEKPRKGIFMRAGYSYNIRTGEEKKLVIEKLPVWPWTY